MKILIFLFLNLVVNTTEIDFADSFVQSGLEELGLEDVKVTIVETPIPGRNYVVQGFGEYHIFLDSSESDRMMKKIITHELIHIQQYEEGRFAVRGAIVEYNSKQYNMELVPFEQRPWEIQANREGRDLLVSIR